MHAGLAKSVREGISIRVARRHFGLPHWLLVMLRALLVVGLTLTAVYLVILISSQQPREAFSTLLLGPAGSRRTLGNWIDDSAKLTLAGLAFSLVFQARQFSLGAQGQAYFGGLAAGLVALSPLGQSWLAIPLGLVAAGAAGAAYGFIPGVLKARLGANEIVSSLMLNYIAIDIFAYLIRAFIAPRGGSLTTSSPFPATAIYPALIPNSRVDLGVLIALVAASAMWFALYRTRWGYELRMTGFSAGFAEHAGIDVRGKVISALTASGLIAGALGAALVQGQSFGELAVGFESGITFDGLLVAIIARNNPLAVPIAALLFGYFRQGATLMGFRTDVPAEVIGIVRGVVILLVASHGVFAWLDKLQKRQTLSTGGIGDGSPQDA